MNTFMILSDYSVWVRSSLNIYARLSNGMRCLKVRLEPSYMYYAANFACKIHIFMIIILIIFNAFFHRITLALLNPQLYIFENTIDLEQLASDEAI